MKLRHAKCFIVTLWGSAAAGLFAIVIIPTLLGEFGKRPSDAFVVVSWLSSMLGSLLFVFPSFMPVLRRQFLPEDDEKIVLFTFFYTIAVCVLYFGFLFLLIVIAPRSQISFQDYYAMAPVFVALFQGYATSLSNKYFLDNK